MRTAHGHLLPTVLLAAFVTAIPACGDIAAQDEAQAPPTMVPARTFSATAYCTGRITRSGARVKKGMAAADPAVLPLGSVIRVDGQGRAYDGVYTIMDTGALVRGRELDLYLGDCREAEAFGRREMQVHVIRRGWNPRAVTPPSTR
jgi:3D (Asp-Asp-Asp) domain-containing protein